MRKAGPLLGTLFLASALPWAALAATPTAADLQALEAKVETYRGLRFKGPVRAKFVDSPGLDAVIRSEVNRSYPAERWPIVERTLKVFGLIPPKMRLQAVLQGMLEEQVVGLYVPQERTLYVNANPLEGGDMLAEFGLGDGRMSDVYLVHELDHALTDQYFNLLSLPLDDQANEDRATAARCVVEGDATWVMLRYLYDALKVPPDQRRQMGDLVSTMALGRDLMGSSFPRYLEENLLVGYLGGLTLVQAAYDRGGFAAVNGLYLKPPQSMEQVLHPEKYFEGRDPPLRVTVETPDGWSRAGYRETDRGVWGELNARILLEEWGVPEEAARQAAAGWGGDAYKVFEGPGGASAFVWQTAWDTVKDAAEFAQALTSAGRPPAAVRGSRVTVVKGGPPGPSPGGPAGGSAAAPRSDPAGQRPKEESGP